MLFLGGELKPTRVICGPVFETLEFVAEPTVGEFHKGRAERFKELYAQTQCNLKAAYLRPSKYCSLRRREVFYEVGDLVFQRIHVLSLAANAIVEKLAPKFQGL